jgi:RNA polymerase sigma factor (sigma-70 family)
MKQPFERIVEEHGGTVLRVCRVVLGVHDAEDAWSETFLAAMRAYPRLRRDSNLRAWVLTIAHRKAMDHFRARARAAVPVETLPEVPVYDAEPGGDETWARVRELPRKQRAAVLLRYAGDLSHREVAAVLDCSEEAARRSAHEGLKKLRVEMTA